MQYDFLHSVVEEGVGTNFIATSVSVLVEDLITSSGLFTNPVAFFPGGIDMVCELLFASLTPVQHRQTHQLPLRAQTATALLGTLGLP